MNAYFTLAKPVWIAGRALEANDQAVFSAEVDRFDGVTLYLAGATFYRVSVNGRFLHYGPARTALGYARVDVLPLSGASGGKIEIEAAGYNCCSLSTVNQPSFLCAELRLADGTVLAATGGAGFTAYAPGTRVQKCMRYSKQRHYGEVYDFRNETYSSPAAVEERPAPLWLPRNAPFSDYNVLSAGDGFPVFTGHVTVDETAPVKQLPYKEKDVSGDWGSFPQEEIPYKPYQEIQKYRIPMPGCGTEDEPEGTSLPLTLEAGAYAVIDYRAVYAGFLRTGLSAICESDVILAFSEYADAPVFALPRVTSTNLIEYLLPKGFQRELTSFEPYSFRYVILLVKTGKVRLDSAGIVEMRYPEKNIRTKHLKDPALDAIWNAAKRTFVHNAVDLYTDCPSRERAGWLCDSYFTGKSEFYFTGKSLVETDFLENFLLRPADDPEKTPYRRTVPDGMLPMCYPGDLTGSRFIPQWAMWYILELDEYLRLRNPKADRERYLPLVRNLLAYFERFENADGLLQKLDGWNFVEWSAANDRTKDVNYPTNFLYGGMLEAAAEILNEPTLKEKGRRVCKVTAERSFNGSFFTDNAVLDDSGTPVNTGLICETTQYYALRFGHMDFDAPEYNTLKHAVLQVFGPGRTDEYPEIVKSNAFIGYYVRMETLLQLGLYEKLTEDIKGYFGYMAERTQTLWEFSEVKGSLDHGFASYAAYVLDICLSRKEALDNPDRS